MRSLLYHSGGNVTARGDAGQPGDLQAVPDRRVLLYAAVHRVQFATDREVLAAHAYEAGL